MEGFPWFVIPVVFAAGIILSIFRPLLAYLFALFIILSIKNSLLVYTRMPALGPFNLRDTCIVVMIIAFFANTFSTRSRIKWPKPAVAILVVLFIGFLNSGCRYGFNYYTIRGLRNAIVLPTLFIITANLVKPRDVVLLFKTVLLGAITSSIWQILYITKRFASISILSQVRSIEFISAEQQGFLIIGPLRVENKFPRIGLQIALGGLFIFALLFTQTRSIFLATALALFAYYLWFIRDVKANYFKSVAVAAVVILLVSVILSHFGLTSLLQSSIERMHGLFDSTSQSYSSVELRLNAFEKEVSDWWNSNIFIGNGLFYYQRDGYGELTGGELGTGYGHLGYVAYLSQLGVLGFLVYGIYFPVSVLLQAKKVFLAYQDKPVTAYFIAYGSAVFIFSVFEFLFSSSFLSVNIIAGIAGGTVWALSDNNCKSMPAVTSRTLLYPKRSKWNHQR